MREAIETVRKNGDFFILEDESSGRYAVARWSAATEAWVDDNGVPCRINPTHWHPLESEIHVVDSLEDIEVVVLPRDAAKPPPKPIRHVLSRVPLGRMFARRLQNANGSDTAPSKKPRNSAVTALQQMALRIRHWIEASLETTVLQAPISASLIRRRLTQRRREIALVVACLISFVAVGWWLYRGEVATAWREAEAQAATANTALGEAIRAREAAERATAELRQALQQEQEKAEKLAADLATARREAETQAATKAADEAAQTRHMAQLRQALQAAEAARTEARESLTRERARNQELEQQLVALRDGSLRRGSAPTASPLDASTRPPPPATDGPATVPPPASDQAVVAPRPAIPETPANAEAARLLARASLLLEEGNIGAARNVLDRAVEMGSAQALFTLAETYDPIVLSARQAFGTLSDPAKARDLYTKALAGGVGEARDRLQALRQ